jgi:antitoxin component YwqK of YwqJK toxin-antitoxin module
VCGFLYDNGVIGQKGAYQDDQKNGVWMKKTEWKQGIGRFYKNHLREGSGKSGMKNGKLWAVLSGKTIKSSRRVMSNIDLKSFLALKINLHIDKQCQMR